MYSSASGRFIVQSPQTTPPTGHVIHILWQGPSGLSLIQLFTQLGLKPAIIETLYSKQQDPTDSGKGDNRARQKKYGHRMLEPICKTHGRRKRLTVERSVGGWCRHDVLQFLFCLFFPASSIHKHVGKHHDEHSQMGRKHMEKPQRFGSSGTIG